MKRFLCIALILVFTAFPALSEDVTQAQAAYQYIEGISAYFQVLAQENGDKDAGVLTAACAEKMYQVAIALSVLQEDQYTAAEENGMTVLRAENVELAGRFHDYIIKIGNEYLYIQMQSKSEAGENLCNTVIEAGRKNSEDAMMVMLDYENAGALSSTCRYLIHANQETTESLFTRTLGETMEIKFNMQQWLGGTEFEWHRTLLFPEA